MKKSKVMFIVGLISLILGLFLVFGNKDRNKDNMDIALNVTSAEEAARLISQNNRSELGNHMFGMFFTGLGLVLTVGSGIGIIKNKKRGDENGK